MVLWGLQPLPESPRAPINWGLRTRAAVGCLAARRWFTVRPLTRSQGKAVDRLMSKARSFGIEVPIIAGRPGRPEPAQAAQQPPDRVHYGGSITPMNDLCAAVKDDEGSDPSESSASAPADRAELPALGTGGAADSNKPGASPDHVAAAGYGAEAPLPLVHVDSAQGCTLDTHGGGEADKGRPPQMLSAPRSCMPSLSAAPD